MESPVECRRSTKHYESPSPTEILSGTESTVDSDTENGTESDSVLPSFQEWPSRRNTQRSQVSGKMTKNSGQQQRSSRQTLDDSSQYKNRGVSAPPDDQDYKPVTGLAEIPESPRQSGRPNDPRDLGSATAVNRVQDKTDAPTIQSQQHEACSSNGLSGTGQHPKRRAGVDRRGSFSQAQDENSKRQTIESGGVSVNITEDSILGVGGRRETDQGTEYRCLILAWLCEDGIPNKKIQEYDNHVARTRRRKSLRRRVREYSPDGDDDGKRMLKKMRRREEYP